MNNIKKSRFPFRLSRYSLDLTPKTFNAILAVKGQKPLINHILNIVKMVVSKITPNWVRLVVLLLRRTSLVYHKQGAPGYVKYLKTCSIMVQQSTSGYLIHDLSSIGPRVSRTNKGLPRIIPSSYRKRIREGDMALIKLILTMFAIFRCAVYAANPKLSTITSARTTSMALDGLLVNHLSKAINALLGNIPRILPVKPIFSIVTASPNSKSKLNEFSSHPIAIMRSIIALVRNPNVHSALSRLISSIGSPSYNGHFDRMNDMVAKYIFATGLSETPSISSTRIGKIGLKQEAAGKVRVFAMVDPFTQWALKPLHSWIFSVLKKISMDGTFNQLRPLKAYPKKGSVWSFDLSAATDRLPLSFQKEILSIIFSKSFADD
jgi:hypothetical protein